MRKEIFTALILVTVAFVGLADEDDPTPGEKVVTEVPVHVGKITRATLHSYVTAFGTVAPAPADKNQPPASAHVASPSAGIVSETKCYEGQTVKKGDLLFQLDSRAIDVAVASAERILERQKKLLTVGGTSQKTLQEAEQQLAAARAQQELFRIVAPLSGTVVSVNAKPGEVVDANSVLAEIIDMDRLVVTAKIPSDEITDLKIGATSKIVSSSQSVDGKLIFVGSNIDPKTGSVSTRVSLPTNSGFRPGQFVSLQILSAEHRNVLAAPLESVGKNEESKSVIAVVEGDKAIQKIIKTGLRDGKLIEVEGDDLKEGTSIVTTGVYALPAETKIRVIGD
jgi:membrane fusion protein (multidrug efflux system)